jgi:nitroreductase
VTSPTAPASTPAPFDLAETDRLLTTTRAVRRRLDLDRPVERGVVLDCLRIATQAPSGGNSQPWRWLVVDEPDLIGALADQYRVAYGPYLEMQRAAIAARDGNLDHPVLRSSDFLAGHLHEVPLMVIPCLLARLDATPTVADTAGFYGSILPAVWSFQLALRSRGLGSCFTTLHLHREAEVGELLGIPSTVTQVSLLPVAHTIGIDFKPASDRRPVEAVTYLNRWGAKPEA